jgi:hypothetical protein
MDHALARIKELEKSLEPFAELGQWLFARDAPDDTPMIEVHGINGYKIILTRGQFKAAHQILHEVKHGQ